MRQAGAALGVALLATIISTHHGESMSASGIGAYQTAFLAAAALALVAALLALMIPDADAASTMARKGTTSSPAAAAETVAGFD